MGGRPSARPDEPSRARHGAWPRRRRACWPGGRGSQGAAPRRARSSPWPGRRRARSRASWRTRSAVLRQPPDAAPEAWPGRPGPSRAAGRARSLAPSRTASGDRSRTAARSPGSRRTRPAGEPRSHRAAWPATPRGRGASRASRGPLGGPARWRRRSCRRRSGSRFHRPPTPVPRSRRARSRSSSYFAVSSHSSFGRVHGGPLSRVRIGHESVSTIRSAATLTRLIRTR